MANRHASALKRKRQNPVRRERNRAILTRVKTIQKKLSTVMLDRNTSELKPLLAKTISELDRAATKGVIHHNKAARQVSRLTLKVNQLMSAPQETA